MERCRLRPHRRRVFVRVCFRLSVRRTPDRPPRRETRPADFRFLLEHRSRRPRTLRVDRDQRAVPHAIPVVFHCRGRHHDGDAGDADDRGGIHVCPHRAGSIGRWEFPGRDQGRGGMVSRERACAGHRDLQCRNQRRRHYLSDHGSVDVFAHRLGIDLLCHRRNRLRLARAVEIVLRRTG